MASGVNFRNKKNKRSSGRRQPTDEVAVGRYASDAYSLAKRTAVGLNAIRKLINIETKVFDVNTTWVANQAGTFQCMSLVGQGTDLSNRVGDSIRLQSIEMHAVASVGVTSPASLRLIMFRDLENTGNTPVGTDLVAQAGNAFAASCHYNYINRQARFVPLFDELMVLDATNTSQVYKYRATHNGHIRFRDTTTAVAAQAEGSLWVAIFTDAAATTPTLRTSVRITYTDD